MCLNLIFLLFIHKFILFALTTSAIFIFIDVFIHVIIEISIFIGIYCGLFLSGMYKFISIVILLYLLNMYLFLYLYIYWIGSNFLLFNTCTIKFIEGKFYLKEGHVI